MQFEHGGARCLFGEWDVDATFKSKQILNAALQLYFNGNIARNCTRILQHAKF